MAKQGGVGKLRAVLDYWDCETCLKRHTPEQETFCAVCKRLNREVLLQPPVAKLKKPSKDEAVRVVPHEEWEEAVQAKERQHIQEAELEEARQQLLTVQEREAELQDEISDLRRRLSDLRGEAPEKKVPLKLVGVKKTEPLMEFSADAEEAALEAEQPLEEDALMELLPEEEHVPEVEPLTEPASAQEVPPPAPTDGWEAVPEETPPSRAPAPAGPADEAIRRVEEEIEKIEEELQQLAEQEKLLQRKAGDGGPAPYRTKGYTLYHRKVGKGDRATDFYFFSKQTPEEGDPVPLPTGYKVAKNAKTGLPYLKKGPKGRRRK